MNTETDYAIAMMEMEHKISELNKQLADASMAGISLHANVSRLKLELSDRDALIAQLRLSDRDALIAQLRLSDRDALIAQLRVSDRDALIAQLRQQIEAMTKNRDECADVFRIDRDHELTGPHNNCGCPSCLLHHKYRHERNTQYVPHAVADALSAALEHWRIPLTKCFCVASNGFHSQECKDSMAALEEHRKATK